MARLADLRLFCAQSSHKTTAKCQISPKLRALRRVSIPMLHSTYAFRSARDAG